MMMQHRGKHHQIYGEITILSIKKYIKIKIGNWMRFPMSSMLVQLTTL